MTTWAEMTRTHCESQIDLSVAVPEELAHPFGIRGCFLTR